MGSPSLGPSTILQAVNRSLSWPVRTILLVATVLSVAAIFAVWANRQLLDTGYWTRTNT